MAQTGAVAASVQKPEAASQAPAPMQRMGGATSPGAARVSAKGPELPPDAPVVTLEGVCAERRSASDCKTVITREDLDNFIKVYAPEVSESARGRVAVQYARTLAFSALAEQQGLDKNPALSKDIEAQLKLMRMRILANAFWQNLQKRTAAASGGEVQRYYEAHRERYDQAQVWRLAVPLTAPTESGHPVERAAVKSAMDELRKRAAAGEDVNALQREAFKQLQIQATPPLVSLTAMRRGSVQGDEAKVFDLKPGEVSPVLESGAAFVVLKLDSRGLMPLDAVRQEIEAAVHSDRMQLDAAKLSGRISAQFTLKYLNLPSQPPLFGPAGSGPNISPTSVPRRTGARQ